MEEELPDPIHWQELQYKMLRLEKEIYTFPEKDPNRATSQRLLDILQDQSQKIAWRICLWVQKATEEHLCESREMQITFTKRLSMRLMRFSDSIDLTEEFDDKKLCTHYNMQILRNSQVDYQRNARILEYNLTESESLSIEHLL